MCAAKQLSYPVFFLLDSSVLLLIIVVLKWHRHNHKIFEMHKRGL